MIFISAAAVIFGALIIVGVFFNPLKGSSSVAGNSSNSTDDVIKTKVGKRVDIRYSSSVIGIIQKLPSKNNLTLEISSELHNTALLGLRGEIRYTDEIITYVQDSKVKTVTDDGFKNIEYKFLPDAGNKTTYTYENVQFVSTGQDNQMIASFIPLSTAHVGERYTIKMSLDTGGPVNYAFGEKTIEIVP